MAQSILDRLKEKTVYKDDCWLFIGGNDGRKGYGRIRYKGKKHHVNRISAHLFHGLDLNDSSLHALHKDECPNKSCWKPEHLYIGTNKDNINDNMRLGLLKNRRTRGKHS